MTRLHSVLILAIAILVFRNAAAYNILAIVSLPLKSHTMAFQRLFRELAIKGHSVTVMNNYPDREPVQNLEFVDLQIATALNNRTLPLSAYEKIDSRYLHLYNLQRHIAIAGSVAFDCENLLTNVNAVEHLARGKKYDVILVEQFFSDCGLLYAGVMYDAPIIGIAAHMMIPWTYPRLGLPFDYFSDSYYFSSISPGLYHGVEAFLMDTYLTYGKWQIHRGIYDVFKRHLPNTHLDIEQIAKERMKMILCHQHFSVTGARLTAPQVVEIGGIHIAKPKPVPEEIEQFLANATNGVIYVSFGSFLKSNTMTREKLQHFLDAFKKIPHKILWKLENTSLPEGYDNVYISDWLPQVDVLCHEKVLAFVSHGGMLSLSEAAHCGKPLLAMPFFGDQFTNAVAIRSSGLGRMMFFEKLNADNLAEEVGKLTSLEMQQSAKRISKLWHDRPQTALDSAIYWIEYVARHKSSPPSLPSKGTTWFQSLRLDVYVPLTLIFSIVLILCYFIFKILELISVRFVSNLVCRKYKND